MFMLMYIRVYVTFYFNCCVKHLPNYNKKHNYRNASKLYSCGTCS